MLAWAEEMVLQALWARVSAGTVGVGLPVRDRAAARRARASIEAGSRGLMVAMWR